MLELIRMSSYMADGNPQEHLLPSFIGVRAGGQGGAAAPPNFGQLRFFGQREKIWAKPVFKDVSILFNYFKVLNINLKWA